jgi:acetyl-CoA acetyltransferase
MGAAQGGGQSAIDQMFTHQRHMGRFNTAGFIETARDVYTRAGIGPQDIDVAQFYETFTGQVIMAIEDFGFCKRGEGGAFVENGNIEWPAGSLPINTSGGNLAEAYIHGLELMVEGVRQVRGQSTCQVEGAATCLVVSGPSALPSSAMILRN